MNGKEGSKEERARKAAKREIVMKYYTVKDITFTCWTHEVRVCGVGEECGKEYFIPPFPYYSSTFSQQTTLNTQLNTTLPN